MTVDNLQLEALVPLVLPMNSSKTQKMFIIPLRLLDQSQGHLNPYYLQHNDNTSLVLVTMPLTEENYVSWSRWMMI